MQHSLPKTLPRFPRGNLLTLPPSHQHQLELLNTLSSSFAGNEYRLLIIDSIMACFRVDYCGRGELADRQQKLNQFLSKLTHMAEEFNVCVLMVLSTSPTVRRDQCRGEPRADDRGRQIKSNLIPAPAPSSPVPMAASLLVDIS